MRRPWLLIEMLWLKFNQIVYMRNSSGARHFAGFPIGFNVALGWSDAAMFNLVKALELTLHNGRCLLTGAQIGLDLGSIATYKNMEGAIYPIT